MIGLLTCPNETLLQIIKEVGLVDIESLTLSCKRLYKLGKNALQQQRDLKSKYTKVRSGPGYLVAFLLRDLITDSSVAMYPRDLSFERILGDGAYYNVSQSSEIDHVRKGIEETMKAKIQESPYADDKIKAEWTRGILKYSMADTLLLLCLLPNLQSFSMNTYCTGMPFFKDVIIQIGRLSHQSQGGYHPLSKLTKATFEECDYSHISSFLTLPSLRELHGKSINLAPYWDENTQRIECKSGIKILTFGESRLHFPRVRDILKNIEDLEHFKISFHGDQTRRDQLRPSFRGSSDLEKSLSEYAAHSLLSLDLMRASYYGVDPWESTECSWTNTSREYSYINTLQDFRCLKVIRLSTDLLAEINSSAIDSGAFMYRAEQGSEVFEEEIEDDEQHPFTIRQLKCILPPSVETVSLGLPLKNGAASQTLKGLAQSKEEKFPNLTEITFEDQNDLDAATERECEAAGIMIKHLDKDGSLRLKLWRDSESRLKYWDKNDSLLNTRREFLASGSKSSQDRMDY